MTVRMLIFFMIGAFIGNILAMLLAKLIFKD